MMLSSLLMSQSAVRSQYISTQINTECLNIAQREDDVKGSLTIDDWHTKPRSVFEGTIQNTRKSNGCPKRTKYGNQ